MAQGWDRSWHQHQMSDGRSCKRWSERGADRKREEVKKEHEVIIYLNYGGVINDWPKVDMIKNFLESLKLLARNVKLRLISFADDLDRIEQTMFEVVHAGIHSHFDHIVFTKDRTSVERRVTLGDRWSRLHPTRREEEFQPWPECRIVKDDPKPYTVQEFAQWAIDNAKKYEISMKGAQKLWNQSAVWKVKYVRYHGGKDDYIKEQYGKECNHKEQRVLFVDDEIASVNCVRELANTHRVPVTAFKHRRDLQTYEYLLKELQTYIQDAR